jgi:hypothetical protein
MAVFPAALVLFVSLGCATANDEPPLPMKPTTSPTTHYHRANEDVFDMLSMGALCFMLIILLMSFLGGCYMTKRRGRSGFSALMDYLQGIDEEFSEIDSTVNGSMHSIDLSSNTSVNGWKQVPGPMASVASPLALIENTKICLEMYQGLFGDLNVPIVSTIHHCRVYSPTKLTVT